MPSTRSPIGVLLVVLVPPRTVGLGSVLPGSCSPCLSQTPPGSCGLSARGVTNLADAAARQRMPPEADTLVPVVTLPTWHPAAVDCISNVLVARTFLDVSDAGGIVTLVPGLRRRPSAVCQEERDPVCRHGLAHEPTHTVAELGPCSGPDPARAEPITDDRAVLVYSGPEPLNLR